MFYRAWLQPIEDGLQIRVTEYIPIHESPSMYWCVTARVYPRMQNKPLKVIRRVCRVRRIHKAGSKVAQPTIDEAIESLRRRKQSQLNHAMREIEIARAFLDAEMPPLQRNYHNILTCTLPDTGEVVQENYLFE